MKKLLLIATACLLTYNPAIVQAATGCNYPASHDTFTDRIAGDFLTTALLNSIMCGVEKLEAGPLRPLDGTVSAPAWSFRDDANTGAYRTGANEFAFVTDGVQRGKWSNTGLLVGTTGTARGNFNSTKTSSGGSASWSVHNTIFILSGQSINLEHPTSGVGSSDGILWVFFTGGAGNACMYVVGGGSNTVINLVGTAGMCATTDTGSGIALIPDGDGTYTLKNRLAIDQTFHMTWLGG